MKLTRGGEREGRGTLSWRNCSAIRRNSRNLWRPRKLKAPGCVRMPQGVHRGPRRPQTPGSPRGSRRPQEAPRGSTNPQEARSFQEAPGSAKRRKCMLEDLLRFRAYENGIYCFFSNNCSGQKTHNTTNNYCTRSTSTIIARKRKVCKLEPQIQ